MNNLYSNIKKRIANIILLVISIAYIYWVMLLCYNIAIAWNVLQSVAMAITCCVLCSSWTIAIVMFYISLFEND